MSQPRPPRKPPERNQTHRQTLLDLLTERPHDLRQLSKESRLSEKDVIHHLEQLEKSLRASEQELVIEPPRCLKCDFVFEQRARFRKPGRCPSCKGQRITQPRFFLREEDS